MFPSSNSVPLNGMTMAAQRLGSDSNNCADAIQSTLYFVGHPYIDGRRDIAAVRRSVTQYPAHHASLGTIAPRWGAELLVGI